MNTARSTRIVPGLMMGLVLALACSSGGAGGGGTGGGSGTGGAGGTGGSGSGGSTGSGGSGSGGSGTGGSSSGGATGTGGAGSGTGGSPGTGGGSGSDAGAETGGAPDGNAQPARVLVYTRHMGPTHEAAIAAAVPTLTTMFKGMQIEVDSTDAVAMLTASNLAKYGAVVLVNTNSTPVGTPGTTEAAALLAFVRAGGGLAAFHASGNTEYPAAHGYPGLLGAAFRNTGGGVRNASCTPEGTHPTVAALPTPFPFTGDEIYLFDMHNPMNQVVLRCDPAPGMGAEKVPSSWVREEGAGRVFYSALGHGAGQWAATSVFFQKHATPALLWILGRTP